MELNMARNERDHLVKERMRLIKRNVQIDRRLIEIEKEMDDLLEMARKKAAEIRGKSEISSEALVEIKVKKKGRGRPRMTLEY
jgi:hypothetical protein